MKNRNRDLLILLKATSLTNEAFEKHIECLHNVLLHVECNEAFCIAHQLATRLKITDKNKKILKAISAKELKPFHFLINKN
jgi:hypothetical protein